MNRNLDMAVTSSTNGIKAEEEGRYKAYQEWL